MNPLGLPLDTFLYVSLATSGILKRSKWVTALTIGLVTGVLSYVVFIQLLGLSFPDGFPVGDQGDGMGFSFDYLLQGFVTALSFRISSGRWSAVSSGRWSGCSPASAPSPGSRSCSP